MRHGPGLLGPGDARPLGDRFWEVVTWSIDAEPEDPLTQAIDALCADATQILRRVDIYEADGETLWLDDVNVIDGSITVSDGAGARRTCTFTFQGDDGALLPDTDGFWFDKILKAYRGVALASGDEFWVPVGVFHTAPIASQHLPANTVQVSGSDPTVVLTRSNYPTVTTFGAGQAVEAVVEQIATYAGVTKFRSEATGRYLGAELQLEPTTNADAAIQKLCVDHGCEAFVAPDGYLVTRVVVPADELPTAFAFTVGAGGSLANLVKSSSDERVYNHVAVRGETSDPSVPSVWAEAENTEPSSPTSIARIGRRTYNYASPMITTEDQAQQVADALLAQKATLDITARISAVLIPWLDVGQVVSVEDPNPAPSDPAVARWLLRQYPIPWTLGPVEYQTARAAKVVS